MLSFDLSSIVKQTTQSSGLLTHALERELGLGKACLEGREMVSSHLFFSQLSSSTKAYTSNRVVKRKNRQNDVLKMI